MINLDMELITLHACYFMALTFGAAGSYFLAKKMYGTALMMIMMMVGSVRYSFFLLLDLRIHERGLTQDNLMYLDWVQDATTDFFLKVFITASIILMVVEFKKLLKVINEKTII